MSSPITGSMYCFMKRSKSSFDSQTSKILQPASLTGLLYALVERAPLGADLDRHLEAMHGRDEAVCLLDGILPEAGGPHLAGVHRGAALPERHRHHRAALRVAEDVAAL